MSVNRFIFFLVFVISSTFTDRYKYLAKKFIKYY